MTLFKGANGADLLLFVMAVSGLYLFARDWYRKTKYLIRIEDKIGKGAFKELTQENN
jgi:hypothetical protein